MKINFREISLNSVFFGFRACMERGTRLRDTEETKWYLKELKVQLMTLTYLSIQSTARFEVITAGIICWITIEAFQCHTLKRREKIQWDIFLYRLYYIF